MPRHTQTGEISAGETVDQNDGGNSTGPVKANPHPGRGPIPKTDHHGRPGSGHRPRPRPADHKPKGKQT